MLTLRDESETTDIKLDRLIEFDERSWNYSIMALIGEPAKLPVSRLWNCPKWLDQGNEGACVGFSWTHELLSAPKAISKLDAKFAREQIYWEAQKIDPWAGGAYPGATPFMEGTSVLSGAKMVRQLGYIEAYRWAFNVDALAQGVLLEGPAVIGIPWLTGMFTPDGLGIVRATGSVAGGHAILVRGYSSKTGYFRLRNSWGKSWGLNGDCLIRKDDMATLLRNQGEACFAVGRKTKSIIKSKQ